MGRGGEYSPFREGMSAARYGEHTLHRWKILVVVVADRVGLAGSGHEPEVWCQRCSLKEGVHKAG